MPELLGATLVKPASGITCSAGKTGSTFDYFLIERSLAFGVDQCYVNHLADTSPHSPCDVVFKERLVDLHVVEYHKPPPIPSRFPFGPRNRPWDWVRTTSAVCHALHLCVDKQWVAAGAMLDDIYALWAADAEAELARDTGALLPKILIRSHPPRRRCRRILDPKPSTPQWAFDNTGF